MVYRVHFVGGLCGTTMLRGAELVEESCRKNKISVRTSIQNVWESPEVYFDKIHVLVQMMPLYTSQKGVFIVNGKPLISHVGEKELIQSITNYLLEVSQK